MSRKFSASNTDEYLRSTTSDARWYANQFSITFWVHRVGSSTTNSGGEVVFAIGNSGAQQLQIRINASEEIEAYQESIIGSASAMTDDTFHHVAIVAENSTTYSIYFDGVATASSVTVTARSTTTNTFTFGANNDDTPGDFLSDLVITAPAFWTQALSGSDVLNLYSGVKAPESYATPAYSAFDFDNSTVHDFDSYITANDSATILARWRGQEGASNPQIVDSTGLLTGTWGNVAQTTGESGAVVGSTTCVEVSNTGSPDSYADCGTGNYGDQERFTYMGWFYITLTNNQNDQTRMIARNQNTSGNNVEFMYGFRTDGGLKVRCRLFDSTAVTTMVSTNAYDVGEWHLGALTYSTDDNGGFGQIKLVLDGKDEDITNFNYGGRVPCTLNTNYKTAIAAAHRNGSFTDSMQGWICEMSIQSKALTTEQILRRWLAGSQGLEEDHNGASGIACGALSANNPSITTWAAVPASSALEISTVVVQNVTAEAISVTTNFPTVKRNPYPVVEALSVGVNFTEALPTVGILAQGLSVSSSQIEGAPYTVVQAEPLSVQFNPGSARTNGEALVRVMCGTADTLIPLAPHPSLDVIWVGDTSAIAGILYGVSLDAGFEGSIFSNANSISGTGDYPEQIYQNGRTTNPKTQLKYTVINMHNMPIHVIFHFAEEDTFASRGYRRFSAAVEGVTAGDTGVIDIFSRAGGLNTAVVAKADCTVVGGSLEIVLTDLSVTHTDGVSLCAFEVIQGPLGYQKVHEEPFAVASNFPSLAPVLQPHVYAEALSVGSSRIEPSADGSGLLTIGAGGPMPTPAAVTTGPYNGTTNVQNFNDATMTASFTIPEHARITDGSVRIGVKASCPGGVERVVFSCERTDLSQGVSIYEPTYNATSGIYDYNVGINTEPGQFGGSAGYTIEATIMPYNGVPIVISADYWFDVNEQDTLVEYWVDFDNGSDGDTGGTSDPYQQIITAVNARAGNDRSGMIINIRGDNNVLENEGGVSAITASENDNHHIIVRTDPNYSRAKITSVGEGVGSRLIKFENIDFEGQQAVKKGDTGANQDTKAWFHNCRLTSGGNIEHASDLYHLFKLTGYDLSDTGWDDIYITNSHIHDCAAVSDGAIKLMVNNTITEVHEFVVSNPRDGYLIANNEATGVGNLGTVGSSWTTDDVGHFVGFNLSGVTSTNGGIYSNRVFDTNGHCVLLMADDSSGETTDFVALSVVGNLSHTKSYVPDTGSNIPGLNSATMTDLVFQHNTMLNHDYSIDRATTATFDNIDIRNNCFHRRVTIGSDLPSGNRLVDSNHYGDSAATNYGTNWTAAAGVDAITDLVLDPDNGDFRPVTTGPLHGPDRASVASDSGAADLVLLRDLDDLVYTTATPSVGAYEAKSALSSVFVRGRAWDDDSLAEFTAADVAPTYLFPINVFTSNNTLSVGSNFNTAKPYLVTTVDALSVGAISGSSRPAPSVSTGPSPTVNVFAQAPSVQVNFASPVVHPSVVASNLRVVVNFADASPPAEESCGLVVCEAICVYDIWNWAMRRVGLPGALTSTDEQDEYSILIRENWNVTRKAFVMDHSWNCCNLEEDFVTATGAATPGNWAAAWTIPDCALRVLTVDGTENRGGDVHWKVQGDRALKKQVLLTVQTSTPNVMFISDILDTHIISAQMAKALALVIAYEQLSESVGMSNEGIALLRQDMFDAIAAAKGSDGQEQFAEVFDDQSIIDEMRGQGPSWSH